MNRTTLQVPMSADLRREAEKQAIEQGFSSLQEAVRLLLTKMARGLLNIEVNQPVQLSSKAIKRYNKVLDDIEKGKNLYKAKDVDDLMKHLHSGT